MTAKSVPPKFEPAPMGPDGLTGNNPPAAIALSAKNLKQDYLDQRESARVVLDRCMVVSGVLVRSQKNRLLSRRPGIDDDEDGPDLRHIKYRRDDRKLFLGSPLKTSKTKQGIAQFGVLSTSGTRVSLRMQCIFVSANWSLYSR